MRSQELQQLGDILMNALRDLETMAALYLPNGSWPSLDSPYTDEQLPKHVRPEVQKLRNIIVAAAYQLMNSVRDPFASLIDVAGASLLTAALNTANELNIAEILREGNPDGNGIPVAEIAEQCQADPDKLGRCLRLLSTHHIFRETFPNVFAHNRISSLLDTSIPHMKLRQDQLNKFTTHDSRCDISGYVGHFAEDVRKAATYHLEDCKLHPSSPKSNLTAFQKAYSFDGNMFNWMHDPSHKYEFTRHNACIRATTRWDPPEALLQGFDWASLPTGSLVVDVGGGTGEPTLVLARTFSHLKILIQDQEPVIGRGIEYWKNNYPEALEEGRVFFAVHNFFQTQPVTAARVYFARMVVHDWADDHVIQILGQLRKAASEESHLVVADYITPFSSRTGLPQSDLIRADSSMTEPPSPLLPNFGKASVNTYYMDLTMQILLNGKERTLPQHIHVIEEAGWRVVEVRFAANSNFGFIIARPT